MSEVKKVACLITTDKDKRGVFMGFIDPNDAGKEDIVAEEIRMAVMWGEATKGVLGLASKGPDKSCRITGAVKKGLIKGVTCVLELSEEAIKNWRKEPWC